MLVEGFGFGALKLGFRVKDVCFRAVSLGVFAWGYRASDLGLGAFDLKFRSYYTDTATNCDRFSKTPRHETMKHSDP